MGDALGKPLSKMPKRFRSKYGRHDKGSMKDLLLSGKLTPEQKKRYFEWVKEADGDAGAMEKWYGEIRRSWSSLEDQSER